MVTDEQVRRLRKLSNTEKNQEIAASKAGMDPTTGRLYMMAFKSGPAPAGGGRAARLPGSFEVLVVGQ